MECSAALARLVRERKLERGEERIALQNLRNLQESWMEVQPTEAVREAAVRLLRIHGLRSSDSLQLAAALVASEYRPTTLEFVCMDERLSMAADREGFPLVRLDSHD